MWKDDCTGARDAHLVFGREWKPIDMLLHYLLLALSFVRGIRHVYWVSGSRMQWGHEHVMGL